MEKKRHVAHEGFTTVQISPVTYLVNVRGEPTRIFSTAANLDGAFDKVCQHVGEHLGCGSWEKWDEETTDSGFKPPVALKGDIMTVNVFRGEGAY